MRLASTFHGLHAITSNLSPTGSSSGIEVLEAETFKLQCYQTPTGMLSVTIPFTTLGFIPLVLWSPWMFRLLSQTAGSGCIWKMHHRLSTVFLFPFFILTGESKPRCPIPEKLAPCPPLSLPLFVGLVVFAILSAVNSTWNLGYSHYLSVKKKKKY